MSRETLRKILPFAENTISLIFALSVASLAFSQQTKQRAREERGDACQECAGVPELLEAHHRLPQKAGGNDHMQNLLLVCEDCHCKLDRLTEAGILDDGTLILDVKHTHPELIGDKNKYTKAVKRFISGGNRRGKNGNHNSANRS
ncbi:MAG: HNH endonuclease signature motif containing protein [Patescibacteria group bacterium]